MDRYVVPHDSSPDNPKPLQRPRWKRPVTELTGRLSSKYRHKISGLLLTSYSEVVLYDSFFRDGISGLEFDTKGIYLASVTKSGCLTVHEFETLYCLSKGLSPRLHEDETKHVLHLSTHQQLDVVRWNLANQDEVACTSMQSNEVLLFDIGYISSQPVEVLRKRPTTTVHGCEFHKGLRDIAFTSIDKSRSNIILIVYNILSELGKIGMYVAHGGSGGATCDMLLEREPFPSGPLEVFYTSPGSGCTPPAARMREIRIPNGRPTQEDEDWDAEMSNCAMWVGRSTGNLEEEEGAFRLERLLDDEDGLYLVERALGGEDDVESSLEYHSTHQEMDSWLLASDTYGVINVWDRRTSNLPCLELTTNSRSTLNSIQLNVDNQIVFGAGSHGTIYAWDLRGGRTSLAFQSHKEVYNPPLISLKLAAILEKIRPLKCQRTVRFASSNPLEIICPCCFGEFLHKLNLSRTWLVVILPAVDPSLEARLLDALSLMFNPPIRWRSHDLDWKYWLESENEIGARRLVPPATVPRNYFVGPGLNELIEELTQNH
ncbi:hypothetical protein HHK36_017373 [Tetracentron sinense]|uniref:Uncharacterized protein n=1 Tax=Tetracentron sinense TaxID=13715 RepID=A0A835DCS6_TETSI|nr:hypothetical protein HHK36_017373 [Tetracentron sinense]